MAADLEVYFGELENRVASLQKNYIHLKKKYSELANEHEEVSAKYSELKKENQLLVEQQKEIKIQSAIAGNADHNRMMKNYINRLVKEIDTCIAQLQQTGL